LPAPDESSKLLAELAMAREMITAEQAEVAFDVMAKMDELGVPEEFGRVLVKKGFISEGQLKELEARVTPKQPTMIGGYEILSRLGRGGMGAVYKARQISMDRLVALKVLPPVLARDKSFIERFFREARAVARLNHPNIVQGIDVGVAEKYYYFAMEFVDGETVESILGRKGPMAESEALGICLQVAQALHHASRHDMIHRDVKPDNIMVARGGVAKLCDLGLAKSLAGESSVTQTGLAVGTPHYISPEQARGEDDVDIRADIYSLGATLYHMVAGRTPYSGSSAAVVMTKHLNDDVPDPRDQRPELSMGLVRLIEKMMAKERRERYQSPEELIKDINLVLSGKSPAALRLAAGRSVVRGHGGAVPRRRKSGRSGTRHLDPVAGSGRRAKLIGLLAGCAAVAILGTVVGLALRERGDGGDLPPPENGGSRKPPDGNNTATGNNPPQVTHPRDEMRKRRLARLKRELESIREYRSDHPREFAKPAKRLSRLIEAAKGTEYALQGQQDLERLYDEQFADAKARAGVLEKQGRFQKAYDVFNGLPLVEKLNRMAAEEQARIKELATSRFDAIRRRAWKRLGPDPYTGENRGDLAAAQKHLRLALKLKMSHVLEAVDAELPKLAAEHRRRTEDLEKRMAAALQEKKRRLYAEFVVERDRVFEAGAQIDARSRLWIVADPKGAARVRRTLLASRFEPFRKEARRVVRDFAAAGKFVAGLKDRISRRKGELVTLRTASGGSNAGILVEVSDRLAGVRPRGMYVGAISQNYTDLTTECIVKLAGLDAKSASDAYLAGVFAFFAGRKGDAAPLFKVAAGSPKHKVDAEYYLAFAREAYRQAREKQAAALLRRCRDTYRQLKAARVARGDSRWQLLRDELQRLKDEYAETETVKQNLDR